MEEEKERFTIDDAPLGVPLKPFTITRDDQGNTCVQPLKARSNNGQDVLVKIFTKGPDIIRYQAIMADQIQEKTAKLSESFANMLFMPI